MRYTLFGIRCSVYVQVTIPGLPQRVVSVKRSRPTFMSSVSTLKTRVQTAGGRRLEGRVAVKSRLASRLK